MDSRTNSILPERSDPKCVLSLVDGQVALREGQACDSILFVEQGELRVFKVSEKGREIGLYHVHGGESCALTACSALTGNPYPATAMAVGPVRVRVIPVPPIQSQLQRESETVRLLVRGLVFRCVDLVQLVGELAFDDVEHRLARLLVNRSESRRAKIRATHAEIAAELGTAREVVTRHLEAYAARGWVRIGRGQIAVLDRESLRATSSQQAPRRPLR